MPVLQFNGFSPETIQFFQDLSANNDKATFEALRPVYENYVLKEAMAFVSAMGERLRTLAPDITAIPKIDKSIFRIHRDVRFSPDKSPYKTHLGIYFWEGGRKKLESPGFYFQLKSDQVFFGVGFHIFTKDLLPLFRAAVVDDRRGPILVKVLDEVGRKNGDYNLGWIKYKRIPRGFDPEHPRADLLRHGGLGFEYARPVYPEVHRAGFLDDGFRIFSDMVPVHFWLMDMIRSRS